MAAVRRAAFSIKDLEFMKLFYGLCSILFLTLIRKNSNGDLVQHFPAAPADSMAEHLRNARKRKDACDLYLWQYKDEYQECISAVLEKYYGASGSDGTAVQICYTATRIAKDYPVFTVFCNFVGCLSRHLYVIFKFCSHNI